jgi:hypothetical protein
MSVGDDTLARFFKGEVSSMFGEIELRNTFGEGRDDVGLAILTAEDSICVWPKSCVPPNGTAPPLLLVANGFLGTAGVSGARFCGL